MSNTQTVSINVIAVNDAPVAKDDEFTVQEDSIANVFDVLANDTDTDVGQTLTVTAIDKSTTEGSPVIVGNIVEFTPSSNFDGETSFNYTVFDGEGGTDLGTVTVTVNPVPDSPQANNDTAATDVNTAINIDVLNNDVDADDETLSVTSVDTTTSGTTSINLDGTVRYTPNNAFVGSDSFNYTISDGGDTDTATVFVTVAVLDVDFDSTGYIINHAGEVTVTDSSSNTNTTLQETVFATVNSTTDMVGITIQLTETGNNTGVFLSNNFVVFSDNASDATSSNIEVAVGDTVQVQYVVVNDTASIGAEDAGIPTSGNAVNTVVSKTCTADDGDAICDTWEKSQGLIISTNLDLDGDGTEETPAQYFYTCGGLIPGDDPICPVIGTLDVYIEIDYMEGHKPDPDALAAVQAAFLAAPDPINLHLQVDEEIPHEATITVVGATGTTQFDQIKQAHFMTVDERAGLSAEDLLKKGTVKRQVFKYALFAHNIQGGGSGYSETPGNDIIISLGNFDNFVGTTDQQSGTLMHEFGHSLGLLHGGAVAPVDSSDELIESRKDNCKPNYLSVMSYSRQLLELTPGRELDFSRLKLADLDENNLTEADGVQLYAPSTGQLISYGPAPVNTSLTGVAIDWDRDGTPNDEDVVANINDFDITGCNDSTLKVLEGGEDWSELQFNHRILGSVFYDGIRPDPSEVPEINFDILTEFRSTQVLEIGTIISNLTDGNFTGGPSQSRQELVDDLAELDVLLGEDRLEEAIVKLLEIRSKMDSSVGGEPGDDLIDDTDAQAILLPLIDDLIAVLQLAIVPANLLPIANDDLTTTQKNVAVSVPVLVNDGDPENDPLTILSHTTPSNGTAVLNTTSNEILYTPSIGFVGTDTFNYTISDRGFETEGVGTANATVTIAVTNNRPIALPDSYTVSEGGIIDTVTDVLDSVLANDTDVDSDPLTSILISDVSNGALSLTSDGNFTYTHDGSETTSDSFTYVANDGFDNSTIVIVTISVTPVNDVPVASPDSYTVSEGGIIDTVTDGLDSVLANDEDAENNALTSILINDVSNGVLALSSNGHFVYTHDDSETTSDSFTYLANDGELNSTAVTVSIVVTPENDPPVGAPDSYSIDFGELLDTANNATLSDVLANDADVDSDTLAAVLASPPSNAEFFNFLTDGNFEYLHDGSASQTDSFTYVANDGEAFSEPINVTISIGQDADIIPPVVTVPADLVIDLFGELSTVVVYSGQSAVDDVDGSITPTCTPESGTTLPIGVHTITCSATDSSNNIGTANFTVTINLAGTPGKVTTGGAQLEKGDNFGFNIQSDDGQTFKGQLQYNNRVDDITLHSEEITLFSVSLSGIKAVFDGTATNNGDSGFTFRIIVEDNGEPGDTDFFSITIRDASDDIVYQNEGLLSRGNIQIHKN